MQGQSFVGLHEILFLVMIRPVWSEYIVVFEKEMIETIYMKRVWFHSVLVLLVESHGSPYQTLLVEQVTLHKWRNFCHRHFDKNFWLCFINHKKCCCMLQCKVKYNDITIKYRMANNLNCRANFCKFGSNGKNYQEAFSFSLI